MTCSEAAVQQEKRLGELSVARLILQDGDQAVNAHGSIWFHSDPITNIYPLLPERLGPDRS